LIVEEAGGVISSVDGGPFDIFGDSIVASSTVSLQQEIVAVIATAVV
jgi:fructose-1,6-bisphosphatase/inositol monophosphatase family enzyme